MAKYRNPETGEIWDSETGETTRFAPKTEELKDYGGADFSTRLGLGFKFSPESRANYLKETVGEGNYFVDAQGNARIKDPTTGQWKPVDEPGFSMGDFADIGADVFQAAPLIASGLVSSNPYTAGLSGLLGTVGKQAIGAMLPGEEQLSPVERGTELALNTAIPFGMQKGVNMLFGGADALRPHNIIANRLANGGVVDRMMGRTPRYGSMNSQFAQQGQRISQQTGIPFTVGQMTGNRGQLMAEGLARRMPSSADDVYTFDQQQVKAAETYLNKLLEQQSKIKGGERLGSKIETAFDDYIGKLVNRRKNLGNAYFGEVDRLAGNEAFISSKPFKDALGRMIQEGELPGSASIPKSLLAEMKSIYSEVPELLTAKQAHGFIQQYSKGASGTPLFKALESDKAGSIGISKYLLNSLNKTLDDAVSTGGKNQQAVEALRYARKNYALNSQSIREAQETVLGKLFNTNNPVTPEVVANKFLTAHPSEIRSMIKVINKADPELVGAAKRHVLETIMSKSIHSGSQQTGAQLTNFSPAKFMSSLDKQNNQLKALLSPKEYGEVRTLYKGLARIADKPMEGSPTMPLQVMWDAAKGVLTLNPVNIGRAAAVMLAPRHIAKAMTTPEGRQALLRVTHTRQGTKGLTNALAYLSGLVAQENQIAPTQGQITLPELPEQMQ